MSDGYIITEKSCNLQGEVKLLGAKNAVLVIMASLILTKGKSILTNVPSSSDVLQMIELLRELGAIVFFDTLKNYLEIDTSHINKFEVSPQIMNKMRASILVMGPLLARFGKAKVALPGGCLIGARPIDYHIKSFKKMGVCVDEDGPFLNAETKYNPMDRNHRIVLEYPSVGATENILMFAALGVSSVTIINAALEPEVLDLIKVLKKMGANIICEVGSVIHVKGVTWLRAVVHDVVPDRLEAGAILLATAIAAGDVFISNAYADSLDIVLDKLIEMGHVIKVGSDLKGIRIIACSEPRAVSFKTGPYPSFPTDLQAPMMAVQCLASGRSIIEETVFENRFLQVSELRKLGAKISLMGSKVAVDGVRELVGTEINALDIRASCSLVIAGLAASGFTKISGLTHFKRGYDSLHLKLAKLGGKIKIFEQILEKTIVQEKISNI